MSKKICFLLALLLGALAVVASATGTTAARSPQSHPAQDYPPRPGRTAFVIGPPTISPAEPGAVLRGPQQQTAADIALHDAHVKRLLHGKPFHAKSVALWASQHRKLLG